MADYLVADDEEAALEQLHRDHLTDGLPVVIPTRRRIAQMILAGGHDADLSLGTVGPSLAAATVDIVAANAVMAGCLPEHFPVVIAAVKAICDPRFDLTETQVTTHPITPLLIVNGPAREECGIATGCGAFGPGYRANAAIGRAVRLVMMNVGGGRPGISDMSTLGSPAKFTFCAGENEEASPWPPLHVSRGWRAEQSTVTALSVEGPHSVLCAPMPDDQIDMAAPAAIRTIASAVGSLGSNSTYLSKGDMAVIINPQTASILAGAGYTREKLQEELIARSRHTRAVLRRHNPLLIAAGADEDIPSQRDPKSLVIVVAGSPGGYVMVCPTLGVGPHNHPSVTKEIELHPVCEIPAARIE
jgi:hypothetical protein